MALYSANNRLAGTQQVLTTTFKTQMSLTAATGAATLKRGWIYDVEFGADGQPNGSTDCSIVYDWSRQTAAGTSTSATPNPVDPADTAAGLICSVNFTAEGTVTAASSLMSVALNQRNSQRWIARDEKSALIIPATNLAGIAVRALSTAFTSTVLITQFHAE
jgi:hypothetical protein